MPTPDCARTTGPESDRTSVVLADVQRVVRAAAAELRDLTDARARAAADARARWRGGHRLEFDERMAGLDREARRAAESLHALLRAIDRAVEEAGWRP
jgi:uncharacterized protein YukE